MKIAISSSALLDLDAPTLPAYETTIDGATLWAVWCEHCSMWHYHGAGEGHREAHCKRPDSSYWPTGYNVQQMVEDDFCAHPNLPRRGEYGLATKPQGTSN